MSMKIEDVATPDDAYDAVMLGLDFLISKSLRSLSSEQWAPSADVDASGDKMNRDKEKVVQFRILRDKFETVYHGAILS